MLVAPWLEGAERKPSRSKGEPGVQVELFDAAKAGQVDVKIIPNDSRQARLVIANKTKQPLSIKLPDTFAATPVLAQAGRIGGGGTTATAGGGAQSFGGGMGGMGMGGMGMGMGGMGGGGFFNVPPEKVGKLTVACVCLEHGKAEPRPAIPYELKPLEQYSSDPQLKAVLKLLGQGKINQRVAQAAAWHLANHMSWEELISKKLERIAGPDEPYFHPDEIEAAMRLVNHAAELAADEKPADREARSPGEQAPDASAHQPIRP
jgi:hypothetical protein